MHPSPAASAALDSSDVAIAQRIGAGDRGVWSESTLDRFLANPLQAVPGTAMGYAGVTDRRERADLIAYLKRENASPACAKR